MTDLREFQSDLLPNGDDLAHWLTLYLTTHVSERSKNTFRAKKADLAKFLEFFAAFTGDSTKPDLWTRSLTESFRDELLRIRCLAPTSVNRVLATVRHAAKWIHDRRPFLVGDPCAGVKNVAEDEPAWRGLNDLQINRLISASEQLIAIQNRASQLPRRNRAMLMVLLHTGLRASELLSLDYPTNFNGTYLLNVLRKGSKVTAKLRLPQRARQAVAEYLTSERGNQAGPLFQSARSQHLATSNLNDALARIASQANANLPSSEHQKVTAHMLRHTALRKAAGKDIRHALRLSGHSSSKYIWRYVQPDDSEFEDAIEDMYR